MRPIRTAAALALALAICRDATAQLTVNESMEEIAPPIRAPRTVGELIEKMRGQARASVISVDWTTDSFLIPVAGNTAGGGGTYFRSDVAFNNDRLVEQRIAVGWLAQGQNSCASPLQYFVLSPNSITIADDFVNRSLNKAGLGGVLVIAVTAAGDVDFSGQIDGYSRIWTPQPGSAGTTSQNFSAIDVKDSLGSLAATLMGLKQSSQYRTNVGVVNLDTTAAHTWTFTSIFNGRVTSVTVPACSMMLTGATAGSASASGNVAFTVRANGSGFYWSGFGSSTDNITGDGWVSRAIQ